MGTHPIFESDFDCLTESKKKMGHLKCYGLKFTLPWKNGFKLDQAQHQWINYAGEGVAKLRKEVEFHFNIRKFRLYYYDDDAKLNSCFDDEDWAEVQLLAEKRRHAWSAIRKRSEKPAWLYDVHFIIKDAYMVNN